MRIDLSQLGNISGQKYGEQLSDPVCVCGFEKALSAGELIDFGDPLRPVMECIELISTRLLVHSRVVSLYYVTKFIVALVTEQGVPAGAQIPWVPDEISKAKILLSCFESHEEALLG